MISKLYTIAIVVLIVVFTSCKDDKNNHDKNKTQDRFIKSVQELKTRDSVSISDVDSIKIKFLFTDTPEIDAEDKLRHEDGYIDLKDYKVLYKPDVLKITDRYVLVLLKHKSSFELRAATIKTNGDPIETILLHNHFGNNEFEVTRDFASLENIHYNYDPVKNEFTFTDMRNDTEWVTYPTKGKKVVTYNIERNIGLQENGEFFSR